MTNHREGPAEMMAFLLTLEGDNKEMAAKIKPLPANITPSESFVRSTRARLLQAIALEEGEAAA